MRSRVKEPRLNPNPHQAHEARRRYSAIRATEDPVALARAARIIRAALERNMISLADLVGNDAAA